LGCRVLAEALRRRGYDVDESAARLGAGGSLAARRERSDRADLVVVDAGGRFRGEVTAVVGDRSRTTTVGGLEVRLVETEQVVSVVTALLPDADALAPLLDALDRAIGTADRPVARSSADRIPRRPPEANETLEHRRPPAVRCRPRRPLFRFPGRGAETNGRRRTPTTPSRGGASCAGRRRDEPTAARSLP
jgi:hypothetical protein